MNIIFIVIFKGIDVKSMGRIFVGLVKCGAWGCFDEFNRLEESVLSAVSMQIQTIQDALKNHRTVCELLGKEVQLYRKFKELKYFVRLCVTHTQANSLSLLLVAPLFLICDQVNLFICELSLNFSPFFGPIYTIFKLSVLNNPVKIIFANIYQTRYAGPSPLSQVLLYFLNFLDEETTAW